MSNGTCPAAEATVDYFDHNSPEYAANRYEWFKRIRAEIGPVFWSPYYGGYWVVIGWEELSAAAKDTDTFSSKSEYIDPEDGTRFDGLFLPPKSPSMPMLEEDPPEWKTSRRTLNTIFAPPAVAKLRGRMQDVVDACLDQHVKKGQIDFSRDMFLPVSTILTLELAGLSTDPFEQVARIFSLSTHLAPEDPRWAEILPAYEAENQRVHDAIVAQRVGQSERRGAIGALLDAQDSGVPLSDETVEGLVRLVVGAGVDTTAASLGTTFVALGERPDLVQQLHENPGLLRVAGDEFLRYATPTQGLLRTVNRDVGLGNQQLRRGERVMLCYGAANRDPREFPDPDEVRLDRAGSSRHVAFGSGIHRCLGSHFARAEFDVVLETVLRRIPDFQIVSDDVVSYDNVGIVAGYTAIPATFAAKDPIGVDAGIVGWPARFPGCSH